MGQLSLDLRSLRLPDIIHQIPISSFIDRVKDLEVQKAIRFGRLKKLKEAIIHALYIHYMGGDRAENEQT